ncbi:MAG: hypothetical protein E7549_00615 [Ruminococcaceae bacterium]|nr:hypothetical protein [Oscillospiraceae bacterium]
MGACVQETVRIIETVFPTEDVVLANIVASEAPYGCDPTGEKDSTAALQQALDDCGANGGGVVFLPVGRYLLTDTITIPEGVVLRGDWQDPDAVTAGEALTYGTVLLAKPAPLAEGASVTDGALFRLRSNNGLIGLTVYYPEQSAKDPKPYGYVFYAEFAYTLTFRNITLINAWRGIGINGLREFHEMAKLEHIRITALDTANMMHSSTEVGYTYDFSVSPSYWVNAGEGYAPDDAEAVTAYCRAHCVGMLLGDLDLETLSEIRLDGCQTGILFDCLGRAGFWGIFYDVYITNCDYGVVAKKFSRPNPPLFSRGVIEGSVAAVSSVYDESPLHFCDVKLVGEKSGFIIEDEEDLSAYPMTHGTFRRPTSHLYVAPIAEYDRKDVDVAEYIQETLDRAAVTGGVVYLPGGVYTVCKPLNVPEGVQLTGNVPIMLTNISQNGTVLLSYVSEGDFITLQAYAGVVGVRIYYPEHTPYVVERKVENEEPAIRTQTAVRGAGEGVYALDTVVTCSFIGVDFSGCDRHLARSVYGCCYTTLVKCGGKDGYVEECLANQHYIHRSVQHPYYFRVNEEARVEWDELRALSKVNGEIPINAILSRVLHKSCIAYHVVDATRQKLNNCFMYSARELILCERSADAQFLNDSVDLLPGKKPMFDIRYSTAFAASAMRVFGTSVKNTDSVFDIVCRNDRREAFEKPYHSSVSMEDVRVMPTNLTEFIPLFSCDTDDVVEHATLCTDPDFVKEGSGAWVNEIHSQEPQPLMICHFDPIDISSMMRDGYLHFWFYCDDIEKLADGQIELTSSGHQDDQEYGWEFLGYLEKNGWNELYLPLRWAERTGDPLNPKGVNFMRIYAMSGDCKVAFDDFYFCK